MTAMQQQALDDLYAHVTDARLAADLSRLADNVRFYPVQQRKTILCEAARRLDPLPMAG